MKLCAKLRERQSGAMTAKVVLPGLAMPPASGSSAAAAAARSAMLPGLAMQPASGSSAAAAAARSVAIELPDPLCPFPVGPYPVLDEKGARDLWQKTKRWIDTCRKDTSAEIYLKQWGITQQALDEWYNGQDNWRTQHDKSLAMTVLLRRKIMWLDTRQMVQRVRLLDPLNYANILRMDKAIIDNWYTGALTSHESTDILRATCNQSCTNGILWQDVKRLVEDMQTRLPQTYLQELQIDQKTLDDWKNGRLLSTLQSSEYMLTNKLRARIEKSLSRAQHLALPRA